MNATTAAPTWCHAGGQRYAATSLHSTPLGYDRQRLAVGAALPMPPSAHLVANLHRCTDVEVALHGKLGDSLLALAAARAVTDYLALSRGAPARVRITGPHSELLARSTLARVDLLGQPSGATVVVGDRQGVEAAEQAEPGARIVCDPAAPPCWAADGHAHPDLPARHYLAVERRLGIRLPADQPFTPLLYARPNPMVHQLQGSGWLDGLTIAAITATSWPQLKDYGAQRYTELAERIAHTHPGPVRLLLIGGQSDDGIESATEAARGNLEILHLDGADAQDLADLFPQCDLVLGNDTGLTHLAALTRNPDGSGPPVIGLYARHSHTKWRTGLPHHHAVATGFSEQMHQGDLCPVRDVIAHQDSAGIAAITPAALADLATRLLASAR